MATSLLTKKSVCVVTGASKGLGRIIAKCLAKEFPEGSLFILLARSKENLDDVARSLSESGVRAVAAQFDQSSSEQELFDSILQDSLRNAGSQVDDFQQAVIVHNAGSLGTVDFQRNVSQIEDVSVCFDTNLRGCYILNSTFLQMFKQEKVIINISSLVAVLAIQSLSLYNMVKASRDMMFKVVALEEPNARVLNYAPGPLAGTDMTAKITQDVKDPAMKEHFEDAIANNTLVQCEDSVAKLIQILKKNSFESGCHIDYYDEI